MYCSGTLPVKGDFNNQGTACYMGCLVLNPIILHRYDFTESDCNRILQLHSEMLFKKGLRMRLKGTTKDLSYHQKKTIKIHMWLEFHGKTVILLLPDSMYTVVIWTPRSKRVERKL